MSAIVLVRPNLVPIANALAEGMGWGPANFQGDLAFADPVTRDVLWVGLHLLDGPQAAFAAALAEQSATPSPDLVTLLAGMRIETPATDDDGNPVEFGPTHVAGLATREGWQVTRWVSSSA